MICEDLEVDLGLQPLDTDAVATAAVANTLAAVAIASFHLIPGGSLAQGV